MFKKIKQWFLNNFTRIGPTVQNNNTKHKQIVEFSKELKDNNPMIGC